MAVLPIVRFAKVRQELLYRANRIALTAQQHYMIFAVRALTSASLYKLIVAFHYRDPDPAIGTRLSTNATRSAKAATESRKGSRLTLRSTSTTTTR